MKTLVIGTGAIGTFYGSRLHEPSNGSLVSCVLRSTYDDIQKRGGKFTLVTSKWGTYDFTPEQLFAKVEDAAGTEPWDYLLVGTKVLPDKYSVAELIAPVVTPGHTLIVLLQNGLGIEKDVAKAFPSNPISSACLYIGVTRDDADPGLVRHFNVEKISLGLYRGEDLAGEMESQVASDASEKQRKLVDQWIRTGTTAETVDDIEPMKMHKNIWNACWSVMSIVTGGFTADMMVKGEMLEFSYGVLNELWQVCEAYLGKERFPPPNSWNLEQFIETTRKVGAYKPSMLVDFELGRDCEVDVISTEVVRRAKKLGIAVPRLETLNIVLRAQLASRSRKLNLDEPPLSPIANGKKDAEAEAEAAAMIDS